ncbi:Calx-beta domain-containing protein [Runella sp. SP2]|uniref:Calx-beta domain-containing protein n=1 Tax=Runella sp. SP2 TaxID=2268026 RepID=UPI0013DE63BB|nr:Calx-beta domain-containing protein [Runella sp. SP2]
MKISTPISVSLVLSVLIQLFSLPEDKYQLNPVASPNEKVVKGNPVANANAKRKVLPLSPLAPPPNETNLATQVKTWWLAPSVSALKTVAQVGTDNGTPGPTPGDVLEYTITITNASTVDDATGVKFTDTIDPNTTLVPGSVKTAPIAVNDAYSTVGNVSIDVPVASGLLANDVNLDGDVITVSGIDDTGTEGTVTFNPNGSFTFNPNPGYEGTTSFKYTVTDNTFSSTGTVRITVTGMIWFVNASASTNGDGRLNSPYNTINAFNDSSLDGAGDNIFVYSGSYNNNSNTLLLGQQKLIGQGATTGTLAALAGVTFSVHPPVGNPIPSTGGTRPTINQNANTVNMQSQNRVYGVNISNTGGTSLQGSSFSTALVRDVSVTNTGGVGVSFDSGSLDVILQSVSVTNASNGIFLQNTTGSFQITGTSTTDASGGTLTNISGRGIEIRNATNVTLKNMNLPSANSSSDGGFDTSCDEDDVSSCFAAIYMNVASNVTLNNIDIGATKEHGIMGLSVSNLTMENCTATGNGDAPSEDESALKFRNLSGTCSITGSTFQTSAVRNFHLINNTGTLNLTVNNCIFNDPSGADCFEARTQGSAAATINLTNSRFQRAGTKGIQIIAEGSSNLSANINNCKVERFGTPMAGIEVGSVGTATINYNIVNCTDIEAANEVAVLSSTFNTSRLNGRLNNNTNITHNHTAATIFSTIRMLHEQNGLAKYEIKNNANIGLVNGEGTIQGIARVGTTLASRLDFFVEGNTLTRDAISLEGVELRMGGTGAANDEIITLCSDVLANNVNGPSGTRAIRVRDLDPISGDLILQGSNGPDVPTYWTARGNTNSAGMLQTETGTPTYFVSTSTCTAPSHPTARIAAEILAKEEPKQEVVEVVKVVEAPKQEIDNQATAATAENIQEALDEAARKGVVLAGETVTVGDPSGFLLPADRVFTIKFNVTINTPLPAGVCQISNQGTVTGNNFSTILTDDVAGNPISPTVIQLMKHSLGNVVFRDNNKNGIYDIGDAGINGVVVNLYRDNGTVAGTLDANDVFVTTTTTAGSGLYAFSQLCSGDYIVQIPSTEFNSGKPLNGLISSLGGVAPDPDNNTDNDDNGQDAINGSIASQAITLAYDVSTVENNTTLDFGFRTPTLVSISDITPNEGNGGGTTTFTFTVTRDNTDEAFSLAVNTNNVTANSSDYTPISGGTVSFAAGVSTTATVSVTVNADDIVELNETFEVMLSGAPYGIILTKATGLGTITNDDQAVLSINSVSNSEGNTGQKTYTFTITSSKAVDVPFTVNVATADGTATTGGNDYIANSTTLNFDGTTPESKTFTVQVNGDVLVESNETFNVPLGIVSASGRNVVVSGVSTESTGTGTITNDDNSQVTINDVSLNEGNGGNTNFEFTVTLNNPVSTTVTVDYATAAGTATAGTDYISTSGTLTFNPGETSKTMVVPVVGDAIGEANETFFVNLSNLAVSGGLLSSVSITDAQGLGTILDDDLQFSINDVTVDEGNTGLTNFTFTVSRTSTATAETINYATADNTATTADNDYTSTSGTLSFAAGEANKTITVTVNGDAKVEGNETFFVNLTAPSNGAISDGQGLGTITNDDAATLTLSSVTALSQSEGASGTVDYTFNVTLDKEVVGGFTVAYTTNDGTATTTDNDYQDNDGSLNFVGTVGEVHTITVKVNGDTKVELNENFTVALGTVTGTFASSVSTSGSPQTATITNDDNATVSLAGNVSQSEATTPQVFTVNLSNPVDVDVTLNFATTNGTATTGDYTSVNQTVTFPAGTTTAQTVDVAISNDNIVEIDEDYNVTLSALSASSRDVTFGPKTTGTGTIINNDNTTITLSGGIAQSEGNTGTTSYLFTVSSTNAVQGGFSVNYTTNDGTATLADNDYTDNDGTLIFTGTAGESHQFTVLVNGDLKIENNEDFTTTINSVTATPISSSAFVLTDSPQTGTINNDELDWGDAPTAAQSGFASSYPTTLANNGARHKLAPGGVFLGATVSGDLDGQPTLTANGDVTGDDGVTLPSAFIINTTGSVTVTASAVSKLDAWIDFNRDGDWDDANEKVANGFDLVVGNNTVPVIIPAASLGTSYARFRVSTAGGLSPTGEANDGEVEDYQVSILNNQFAITSPSVTEGNTSTSNLTYTISRTTNSTASSVTYEITGGTATSGSDYVPLALGTVSFDADGPLTQEITVVVNGDIVVENNETVVITLSNPINGAISTGTGTGTINNDDAATLTLSGGVAKNEGNSGNTAYTFTATLSAPVQGGFQVAYTTGNGTATVGTDYTDNDGSLTFTGTAGETKTWTVDVLGDNLVEANETFEAALGAITSTSAIQLAAISLSGSPQTATISNDDQATVSLAGNVSQSEATTPQVFTVNLSNPVDIDVTVNFATSNGAATIADNDYTAVNQTVTFLAGTTTAQTVDVAITNDNKVEANENYNVTLSSLSAPSRNVILGTSTGTGTINNDDASTVTLTGTIAKPEGNTGTVDYTFTATLTNPVQGGFTVAYTTSDGTATIADNDYTDNDGSLTFTGTANETKTITVQAKGDLKIENNENFTVALGAITGAPTGVTVAGTAQTGTIENDELDWGDAPDTYKTLSASNGPSHANAPGGIHLGLTVDADLDGQPNPTATGDGADDDGVTLPSVLVLNTTASVTVNASAAGKLDAWVDFDNNGTFDSGEKVFNNIAVNSGDNVLTFSVPSGATPSNSFARFRISSAGGLSPEGLATDGEVEDYAIQIVNTQFSINDVTITEGNSGTTNLTFTISRTVNANACSVKYGITGGTATSGTDYQTFADGTVSFTADGAFFQTITVVLNGDNTVELDETILMTLSDPINAAILDGSGTGTITNDDASVLPVSSPSVFEGSTGTTTMTFNLNLSNPSDAAVVVNYATVDGTATTADNDYVSTSGTLTFAAGETSKTVTVIINGDCKDEVNETLLLRLSSLTANGRNVSLSGGGATLDGTGTIVNTPLPTATIAGATTVCLAGAAPTVTFTGANGTSPYTFSYQINGTPQTSLVSTGNTSTTTAPTSVPGIYIYTLVSVSDANGCSSTIGSSVTVTVQGKPEITLNAQQQTLNEGNTRTLCDIDSNPVNGLQFNVTGLCVVGNPVWRVKVGNGAWGAWSSSAPASQPSDNQLYRYQAACDASCPTTYTGIITLTINYRASIPQNVSLVADGVTVAAGESKVLCDLPGTTITFNATCAAGEIILYSVDGGDYTTIAPTQLVDGLVHNYRVRCRKADGTPSCIETESAPMSLRTVTTLATPVVSLNPTSSCGGSVPMTSISSCVGTTTIWFNATTNAALGSLPAMSPTTTTSYYARCQTDAGCLSEKSNVVTFTVAPVNTAPAVSVSNTIVCTGTSVTVSANCPAGSKAFWNTGVNENSFQVAFSNATQQSYWAKCIFTDGCQSAESIRMTVIWKAFELTLINIGQSKSGIKAANDKSLWTSQFITRDGGPELEFSTQTNPTLYYVENVNKTAPRFWTIHADVCDLGTEGSLTFDMLATPEVGVPRSFNTHENNAPYFMYANREGWTELYAQNHPAYGFYEDNGAGGNTYDTGLPKGLYKLGVRYWDMKGWGSIYPSTRKPQGNVLTYQEYWFRIQSRDGVGVGGVRTAGSENGQQITDNASFATVMPNPVSKILRLKVANSKGKEVKATLMDVAGRTVQNRLFVAETNAHQEEFDVNDLPSGTYLLHVATTEKQATLKVVKVE